MRVLKLPAIWTEVQSAQSKEEATKGGETKAGQLPASDRVSARRLPLPGALNFCLFVDSCAFSIRLCDPWRNGGRKLFSFIIAAIPLLLLFLFFVFLINRLSEFCIIKEQTENQTAKRTISHGHGARLLKFFLNFAHNLGIFAIDFTL